MIAAAKIRATERRLAKFADRADAVLLGHANTALHLALRYLQANQGAGEIILSPIVCLSVVQTIIYAGFVPVFADVSLPTCTIDVKSAAAAISPRTRAILAIHIFGHAADMAALSELADRHGVWLIEDAAQSIGGRSAGRRDGAWGQASMFSFGGSKIVAAGGGGALLADDPGLIEFVRREAALLPPLLRDSDFKLLSLSHRNITHGLIDALRVERRAPVSRALNDMLDLYQPLYLHRFPENERMLEAIDRGMNGIDDNAAARARAALAYRVGLSGLAKELMLPTAAQCERAIWRFTAVLNDDRKAIAVTQALRDAGLNASNHYWSVAELLQGRRDLPNADFASPRLLNLWVDEAISADDISRTIALVGGHLG